MFKLYPLPERLLKIASKLVSVFCGNRPLLDASRAATARALQDKLANIAGPRRPSVEELLLGNVVTLLKEVAKKQGAVETTKSLSTKQKGLTANEFNPLARDYLKKHAKEHPVTVRELADDLKSKNPAGTCSTGTVSKLPVWRAYQEGLERDRKESRKARPGAVSFTPAIEATKGEGRKREVLQLLVDEQEADAEPSPLEDDLVDGPSRRVWERKRV